MKPFHGGAGATKAAAIAGDVDIFSRAQTIILCLGDQNALQRIDTVPAAQRPLDIVGGQETVAHTNRIDTEIAAAFLVDLAAFIDLSDRDLFHTAAAGRPDDHMA